MLKDASSPYGKVLDVNHITQSASFPLEIFKTTIKKGNYISARCKAANKTWNMKVAWTYNNDTKRVVKQDPAVHGRLAERSAMRHRQSGQPAGGLPLAVWLMVL